MISFLKRHPGTTFDRKQFCEFKFSLEAAEKYQFGFLQFQEKLSRFTHIVVESVETKFQDDFPVHVIFVATREGSIKKLSFNTKTKETCLVSSLNCGAL